MINDSTNIIMQCHVLLYINVQAKIVLVKPELTLNETGPVSIL